MDLEDNRVCGVDKYFVKIYFWVLGGFGVDFFYRYCIFKCCNFLKYMSENNCFDEFSFDWFVVGCF